MAIFALSGMHAARNGVATRAYSSGFSVGLQALPFRRPAARQMHPAHVNIGCQRSALQLFRRDILARKVVMKSYDQDNVSHTGGDPSAAPAENIGRENINVWSQIPLEFLPAAIPVFAPLAAGRGGLLGTGFDISGPESVIQTLFLLAFIVAVHEAGHFAAARLQGIHVKCFSVGFGPTLYSYQGPEVQTP